MATLPRSVSMAVFRAHIENGLTVAIGVGLMRKGLIDVNPLITHTIALPDAHAAFELAADRGRAMKVQIAFDPTLPNSNLRH